MATQFKKIGSDLKGLGKKKQPASPSSILGSRQDTTVAQQVRSIQTFNVKMPPIKRKLVNQTLIPSPATALKFVIKRESRIALEIVGPVKSTRSSSSDFYKLMKRTQLANDETVHVKIFRRKHSKEQDQAAKIGAGDKGVATSPYADEDDEEMWEERYDYKLEDVAILNNDGHTVEVKMGSGVETVVRDLLFEAGTDATSFVQAHKLLRQLEQERSERQVLYFKEKKRKQAQGSGGNMKSYFSGNKSRDIVSTTTSDDEDLVVNLLVEIVSAVDIPAADLGGTSDAFVVVFMGDKKIHQTDIVPKTLDPIWTLKSGSLFVLSMSPEEFFSASGGMKFTVKDYDALGSADVLGRVDVPLDDLLNGTGKRMQYELSTNLDNGKKTPSKLFLRYKEATQDDIDFLEVYKKKSKGSGVYCNETFLPPRPPDRRYGKRQTKRDEDKQQVHRVKPYPDPALQTTDEAQFMTSAAIHENALEHSTHWTEAGSGTLGKLYFEVLGCDHLTNMDSSTLDPTDKTDAFVCLVFEDAIVNTDVIGNCLSPRWPSWSRRSFVFNVSHPESDLFLGVFDYDPETSPTQIVQRATSALHDPIGRVQIKLSGFVRDTVYTLKYNLFAGETAQDRKKACGSITVRLRVEWMDNTKAFLTAARLPVQNYVAVAKQDDFAVAHYVTEGLHDEKGFSMAVFTEYIEELQSYEVLQETLQDAFMSLWLWRGHYPVRIGRSRKKVYLPLHSITAFCWSVLISWDFNFFPSFCFFAIGWVLLATNESRRQSPSPWHQCRSYKDMVLNVVPEEIEPNQNKLEIIEYNREQKKKLQDKERVRIAEEKHDKALREELGEELEEAEAKDEDITTKKGGVAKVMEKISVNPLKPVLYPIQQQLHKAVIGLRIAGSIIRWDEPFYAFWITTIAFTASILAFWFPWGRLFTWLLRVIAWVLLGPWMAIVDRIYFRESPNLSDEEKKELVRKKLDARYEHVLKAASNYRVRKERAIKLQKMKKYMFGKFLLRVPRFSEDLFIDIPLPESSAYPYDKANADVVVVTGRIYGQKLTGDMIPQRDIQVPKAPQDGDILTKMNVPENINKVDRAFKKGGSNVEQAFKKDGNFFEGLFKIGDKGKKDADKKDK